jgi:hypothetical protein
MSQSFSSASRAGNGTRTRDPNLGKVVLYQLSYSRRDYKSSTLIRAAHCVAPASGTVMQQLDLRVHP